MSVAPRGLREWTSKYPAETVIVGTAKKQIAVLPGDNVGCYYAAVQELMQAEKFFSNAFANGWPCTLVRRAAS